MKVAAIVQARMSSSRLPEKVVADIEGYPMLCHIIMRLQKCKTLDNIIVATSDSYEDNRIEQLCIENNIKYFRGNLNNLVDRYYNAAVKFGVDVIVRVTADCPLICPTLIDSNIKIYLQNSYDIVSPRSKDGLIRGLDNETFSTKLLSEIKNNITSKDELEHTTLHIYNNSQKYSIYSPPLPDYYRYDLRLCVDEERDLKLIRLIYSSLFVEGKIIDIVDVINLVKNNPELVKINSSVKQIHF